ncbi:alpha/beta hydrolase-fold protein [Candidatus Chlorohelix sp.]|uniref:alpha/beta hydrolase n=1 Tax=Candidatus Chlorohelix sp. TaxID=3139201 RepID=UPI00306A3B19
MSSLPANNSQPQPDSHISIVTTHLLKFPHILHRHRVDIFLPPGYDSRPNENYKALYVNDGQDMGRLLMKETLEKLYRFHQIEPIIVVAIHASHDRVHDYGVVGIPDAHNRGSKAHEYEQFVLERLLLYMEQHYRIRKGAPNTAISGVSLGGLSAIDLAWRNPTLFGKVGVFSGSFWWRTDDTDWRTQQASRIMHKVVRESQKREGLKFWFQAGTADETSDRDGNGVIDAIQDTLELIDELELKGYRRGEEIVYVQVEGGKHDQETWGSVLPDFLKWAFAAE